MDWITSLLGGSGAGGGGNVAGTLGGVGGGSSPANPQKHGIAQAPDQVGQAAMASLVKPVQQASGLSQGDFQSLLDMSQQAAMQKRSQRAGATPQFMPFDFSQF